LPGHVRLDDGLAQYPRIDENDRDTVLTNALAQVGVLDALRVERPHQHDGGFVRTHACLLAPNPHRQSQTASGSCQESITVFGLSQRKPRACSPDKTRSRIVTFGLALGDLLLEDGGCPPS